MRIALIEIRDRNDNEISRVPFPTIANDGDKLTFYSRGTWNEVHTDGLSYWIIVDK